MELEEIRKRFEDHIYDEDTDFDMDTWHDIRFAPCQEMIAEFIQKEKKELKLALHQLAYDVFFNPNTSKAVTDTLWHNSFCTSFDNIAGQLDIDC